ncbi:MAG: hypothetical protein E7360_03945 [Clostridiales bacterium]|nr:hypothetical protein [Clostridiales bacterium]
MTFDKWFNSQSTLIKAILLLLPVVGWICEILVRLSVLLRTKKGGHLIVFLIVLFLGEFWILGAIDFVYMILNGHLILGE